MKGAITGDVIGSVHEYKDRIKTKEFKVEECFLWGLYTTKDI